MSGITSKEVITSKIIHHQEKRYDQLDLRHGYRHSDNEIQTLRVSSSSKIESFRYFHSINQKHLPPSKFSDLKKGKLRYSSLTMPSEYLGIDNKCSLSKNKASSKAEGRSSTLSLHIAAYENSIEAADEDITDIKKGFKIKSNPVFPMCPFEFPRQQDDNPSTPEIQQFTASQQLFNPNNAVTPKFRGPNKKTLKRLNSSVGGMIKTAVNEFNSADPPTQLQMFKDLMKENFHLKEKLKQTEHNFELLVSKSGSCNKIEDDTSAEDVEMFGASEILINEKEVQTDETRMPEDKPCKKFEEIMVNASINDDTTDLQHYLFNFVQRMISFKKCYLDLKSPYRARDRVYDAFYILCYMAAPRTPLNSAEAMRHRKELVLRVASKFGFQLKLENKISPLEASLMQNECRLSKRCYMKLRGLLKDYCELPSRYMMEQQVKEIDQLFETTVRIITVEGVQIKVTTVDNILELIRYRIETLLKHGNFREMNPPWNKTIFLYEFYDKGGKHLTVKQALGLSCSLLPNDPQRIIFIGAYDGDMKHMGRAFAPNIRQLNQIHSIQILVDGVTTTFNIVRRFCSDTEGILQAHCRKPATSNTFCWNCDYVRPADRSYSNPEVKFLKERAITNAIFQAIKVGAPRLTFEEDDNGWIDKPYFDSKPDEIAFPVLHMWQGLLNDKLNQMEDVLKQMDLHALSPAERAELEEILAESDQQVQKLSAAFYTEQEKLCATEVTVNMVEHLLDNHAVQGHFPPNNGHDGGCTASFCASRAGYDIEDEWKVCNCCNPPKRYHKFCIGFHGCKGTIQCRLVREYLRKNQLSTYLQNTLTKGQENYRKLIVAVEKRKKKLEKALISKGNVSGPNMKQYYNILNGLGVYRNAWFGNFNGNQARTVMTKTHKFDELEAIQTEPRIHHLVTAIKKLGILQNYTVAALLTENQIEELKIGIEDYIQHMVENLGDTNVTPKAHFLLHLYENAAKYKTLGLLSEQAIEALHAYVNSIYPRAAFFKKEERDAWIMKHVWRQNIMKDMKATKEK